MTMHQNLGFCCAGAGNPAKPTIPFGLAGLQCPDGQGKWEPTRLGPSAGQAGQGGPAAVEPARPGQQAGQAGFQAAITSQSA